MAKRERPSRATGVGRGNGAGSRATQFQEGEPTRNPHGRPRRRPRSPKPDIASALRDALAANVPVMRNGKREMMPQSDALVQSVLADYFARATVSEKVRVLKFFAETLPHDPTQMDRTIPPDAIAEFVKGLAEDAERLEEEHKQLWGAR